MKQPLTQNRAVLHLEAIRMAAAEAQMANARVQQLLLTIDPACVELYEGITNEEAPDIEVQPRIVRSVG